MADDNAQQDAAQDNGAQDQHDTAQQSATDVLGEAGKAAIATERKARQDAERARKVAERELEGYRAAAMSDQERAIAEARAQERKAASGEFGQRLVRSEFRIEAAKRNPGFDTAAILDDLNLSRYVTEDGEPDSKAIAKAVERLIPAVEQPKAPSFDGGARSSATRPMTGNEFLRDAIAASRR